LVGDPVGCCVGVVVGPDVGRFVGSADAATDRIADQCAKSRANISAYASSNKLSNFNTQYHNSNISSTAGCCYYPNHRASSYHLCSTTGTIATNTHDCGPKQRTNSDWQSNSRFETSQQCWSCAVIAESTATTTAISAAANDTKSRTNNRIIFRRRYPERSNSRADAFVRNYRQPTRQYRTDIEQRSFVRIPKRSTSNGVQSVAWIVLSE
jgi:hypothetical protein